MDRDDLRDLRSTFKNSKYLTNQNITKNQRSFILLRTATFSIVVLNRSHRPQGSGNQHF